jgi:hypothetical protein
LSATTVNASGAVQRLVPEHELEVLGEQEQRARHAERHEDRARDRADELLVAEEVHVEHRVLGAQLPQHEEP